MIYSLKKMLIVMINSSKETMGPRLGRADILVDAKNGLRQMGVIWRDNTFPTSEFLKTGTQFGFEPQEFLFRDKI
jgi:hypothetical protein